MADTDAPMTTDFPELREARDRARRLVRAAIEAGTLHRPFLCSACGETPGPAVDGRPRIQGHHHDYSKPLEVEWLCAKCHRAVTPLPKRPGRTVRGSEQGQAKLTEADAIAIVRSPLNNCAVGRLYGVSEGAVRGIRRGDAWTHIQSIARGNL